MENYAFRLQSQIDDWMNKVEQLAGKRDIVADHSRPEYDRQLNLMVSRLDQLRETKRLFESRTQDSQQLGRIAEEALKEIDNAFDSAIDKLN